MISDSRGFTRLKKFAGQVPDEHATYLILRTLERVEGDHSSDRTAAILGATIIENALRLALLACFRPEEKDHKGLFEGATGPLATFSSRIEIAYALRIFGPKTLSDLQCIKVIRNSFAHSLMTMDFTLVEIITVCDALTSYRRSTIAQGVATSAKEKYIRSAGFIAGGLKRISLLSAQEITNHRHYVWPAHTELW
jgi:DNA-binding MltR family transcriptional regulator